MSSQTLALPPTPHLLTAHLSSTTSHTGRKLADEVRCARSNGFPVVMLHATPDNEDGCEFSRFFGDEPRHPHMSRQILSVALNLRLWRRHHIPHTAPGAMHRA